MRIARTLDQISVWLAMVAVASSLCAQDAGKKDEEKASWQDTFEVQESELSATWKNPYLILEPGYQLFLQGGKETLTITVLDETRKIGNVETRVVEERETKNGELDEVSRNFLAISKTTNDVFYFGEEVEHYKGGKLIGKGEDAWIAGSMNARFGLLMPGKPSVGQRYYQEHAPLKAMDRGEVVSVTETFETRLGASRIASRWRRRRPWKSGRKNTRSMLLGLAS